jgi:hypothetical protein
MATDSLYIKDGRGNEKSLAAYSSSQGFIVEHAVTASITASFANAVAVTASSFAPVPVTSSASRPVYVTGSVSISQPVNVDVVVGDNISVTSSIAAPLFVSSSFNSPLLVTGTVNVNNYPSITTVTSSLLNPVGVTGTVAISGTPIITGSVGIMGTPAVTVSGTPTITGTVSLNSSIGSPVYVDLAGIGKFGYTDGSALVTKITGNTTDNRFWVTGNVDIGVTKVAIPDGTALVIKSTGSNDQNPTYVTGNVDIGVGKVSYAGGNAIVVKVTSSADIFNVQLSDISIYDYAGGKAIVTKLTGSGTNESDRLWVTGTVTTVGGGSVADGLKVELSGTNVKQLSGSSANTYLQTSIAPVATGSALKVFAPPNWGGPVPSGDGNVILFDWDTPTQDSGTVIAASSSINRKSLTVFNNSPHDIYMLIGNPWGISNKNGFSLYSTGAAPNMYSFILYTSGTYFAEPHNVGMKHSMYLVSSSVDNQARIFVTETY